jgi:hypothetical protein
MPPAEKSSGLILVEIAAVIEAGQIIPQGLLAEALLTGAERLFGLFARLFPALSFFPGFKTGDAQNLVVGTPDAGLHHRLATALAG